MEKMEEKSLSMLLKRLEGCGGMVLLNDSEVSKELEGDAEGVEAASEMEVERGVVSGGEIGDADPDANDVDGVGRVLEVLLETLEAEADEDLNGEHPDADDVDDV